MAFTVIVLVTGAAAVTPDWVEVAVAFSETVPLGSVLGTVMVAARDWADWPAVSVVMVQERPLRPPGQRVKCGLSLVGFGVSVTLTGPAVTVWVAVGVGVAVAVGVGLGLAGPTSQTLIAYLAVKPGVWVPLTDDVMVRQSVGSAGACVPPGLGDDVAEPGLVAEVPWPPEPDCRGDPLWPAVPLWLEVPDWLVEEPLDEDLAAGLVVLPADFAGDEVGVGVVAGLVVELVVGLGVEVGVGLAVVAAVPVVVAVPLVLADGVLVVGVLVAVPVLVAVAVPVAAGRAGALALRGTVYAAAAVPFADGDGLDAVEQTEAVAAGWATRGATAIMPMMLTAVTENPANAVEAAETDLRKLIALPSCSWPRRRRLARAW